MRLQWKPLDGSLAVLQIRRYGGIGRYGIIWPVARHGLVPKRVSRR